MARLLPENTALIEFGSGSFRKARILLDAAPAIVAYVPVDISSQMLAQEAAELAPRLSTPYGAAGRRRFHPVVPPAAGSCRTGPGRILSRLDHRQFRAARCGGVPAPCRDACWAPARILILGVDLVKDAGILNAAYNDAAGVTAKFNLNLLVRINRELGGDFDLDNFSHQAFYNSERRRVEMHLASRKRQTVHVCGRPIEFRAGETIHTESSYKYTVESFGALARGAGWTPLAAWSDPQGNFSVQALVGGR